MGELEKFLHAHETNLPPLVKAGLSHAQFESIHPFPCLESARRRKKILTATAGWGGC